MIVSAAVLLQFGWQSAALAQVSQTAEYVPGEVIVKLRGKSKSIESQAFIGKSVSENAMTLKGSWGGLNAHHFALKPGQSVQAAIAELHKDPMVEYAEPNYIFKKQSTGLEGEVVAFEDFVAQSAVSTSSSGQTSAPIQLQEAWAAATPGLSPPIVAVIDTGVDIGHSLFVDTGAIWTNTREIPGNGVDDDGNGFVDDVNGWNFVSNSPNMIDDDSHGTHVAGIILGATQSITESPLKPAKIRIMPLKFLDGNGSGTTSDAVRAIYYAVNNGAKVLNNSWGGGGFSNSLLNAMAYAYDRQVVFVAAAGNAASNNDSLPTYPANYDVPNVISIAATSDLDYLASFSNFGAQTVHMGSPGVSIWSSLPRNRFSQSMYGRSSGTSMAAPFVSGLAAMIVREAPTMNGYQVKTVIFGGAQEINSLAQKTTTKSRLNLYQSVMAAKGTPVSSSQPTFNAGNVRRPSSLEASEPSVGGCGIVAKSIYDLSQGAGGGGMGGARGNVAFFGLLLVLMAPVFLSLALRHRSGKNQRRYTRYQIDSQVKLRFGDRELVGSVSTISLGGVQLNTDAWLDKGGIVKMSISSPDGRDQVEVEGKVVWSEEQKRYGVAFANANEPVLTTINRWTQALLKA
jgi:subtilisin family serine protease